MDRFLVTGSSGFLGAWITRELIERELDFVLFDLDPSPRRLDQLLGERPAELARETGDISDVDRVVEVCQQHEITHIIHLAALQMPFCRPDPLLGAKVNVLGTLAVFEAARRLEHVRKVVYASSAAVIGPEELYGGRRVLNDDPLMPATHYGVFKQANEGAARVYHLDHGINSIGLRPWTIYGLGRDQGVSSDVTEAIRAAVDGREFTIRYSGRNALQYASDVAAAFVLSALDDRQLQLTFNLRGDVVAMTDFIAEVESQLPEAKGLIGISGGPIPIACDLDDSELRAFLPGLPRTPLAEGIAATIRDFRRERH